MTVLKAKIGGTFQPVLSGYASNVYLGPDPPTDPNVEFWVDTDATLPVVPWIPLPFLGTWGNMAAPYSPCSYRKIGDVVTLRGLALSTSTVNTIAVLPVGFRPVMTFVGASVSMDAFAQIRVLADGTISVNPPATTNGLWVSLNNTTFSTTL